MRYRLCCLAVAGSLSGLLMAAGGCGSDWQNYTEHCVRAGIASDNAPEWVRTAPPDEEGMVYFVGRGIGYNVLDERAAYDMAVTHAYEQLAQYIATRVHERVWDVDGTGTPYRQQCCGVGKTIWQPVNATKGLRILPGRDTYGYEEPEVRQLFLKKAMLTVDSLAGDLADRGVYWEQWYIQEEPEKCACANTASRRMKRYKCWVLMAVPQCRIDARICQTMDLLRVASASPCTLFTVVGTH